MANQASTRRFAVASSGLLVEWPNVRVPVQQSPWDMNKLLLALSTTYLAVVFRESTASLYLYAKPDSYSCCMQEKWSVGSRLRLVSRRALAIRRAAKNGEASEKEVRL